MMDFQEYEASKGILCKVVGVEECLLLLLVQESVGKALGRTRKIHGRKVELAQFALSRQQTTSTFQSKR